MTDSNLKPTPDSSNPEVESQGSGQVTAPKTGDNPKDVDDALRATFTDMEGTTIDVPDDLPSLQPDVVEAWVNKFKIPCRDDVRLSDANYRGWARGGNFLYFQKDGKKFKVLVCGVKFNGVELKDKNKGSDVRDQLVRVMEDAGYFCTTFEEVNGPDDLKRLLKEKAKPVSPQQKEISGLGSYKLVLSSLKDGEAVLWHHRGGLGTVFFVEGNKIFELLLVNLRMDGKYLDREELPKLLRDAGFEFIENPVINDPRWQLR